MQGTNQKYLAADFSAIVATLSIALEMAFDASDLAFLQEMIKNLRRTVNTKANRGQLDNQARVVADLMYSELDDVLSELGGL
jgi:hypothetical protein